jgi:hypothetical protein
MMGIFIFVALIWAVGQPSFAAGLDLPSAGDPARGAAILADWQPPASLPPRFRNHCGHERFTWRPYCADHCGAGYQFYFCSENSFGCCGLGHGYCDFSGLLRCHP